MYYRLNENHPASKAMGEVFAKMEEVGISIEVGDYGRLTVTYKDQKYDLMDQEAAPDDDKSRIYTLPPIFAYKMVYEKESPAMAT